MNNREALIQGLAQEFQKNSSVVDGLKLDINNYIVDTGSLDCTVAVIPVETLEKTLAVIKQHEMKFAKDALKSKEAEQYMLHLRVAKKCVEEVINNKLSK